MLGNVDDGEASGESDSGSDFVVPSPIGKRRTSNNSKANLDHHHHPAMMNRDQNHDGRSKLEAGKTMVENAAGTAGGIEESKGDGR